MALSKIRIAEAVDRLLDECDSGDPEVDHSRADEILLDLIGDPKVRKAYEAIHKWYA